jgi:uncharacterized protein
MGPIINIDEVRDFLETTGPGTKIYLGSDSERYKRDGKWYADYTMALIIHINGKNGCKVFGEMQTEPDYDQKQNRPALRLMNEVYKIADLYQRLLPIIEEYPIEIHLDLNPDEVHGSSCVINQAIGYIRGTCNVVPMVKPLSWGASHCADRLKSIV